MIHNHQLVNIWYFFLDILNYSIPSSKSKICISSIRNTNAVPISITDTKADYSALSLFAVAQHRTEYLFFFLVMKPSPEF